MNPNAIAAGDNPAKLTNAQVGAGYRLIETYRNPSNEDFEFHLDQRQVTVPEVLTKQHGWRAVRWDEVDWALNVADFERNDVTLDDGTPVAEPPSFRVPITAAFIAWKAKQRPERAAAKRRRDRRISEANAEIVDAKQDYAMARKGAFHATAHEYGYVPPGDSVSQGFVSARGVVHNFPVIQFNWYPAETTPVFPPLPAGVSYYNPARCTPGQVRVSEGWRLLRTDENRFPDDVEVFTDGTWKPSNIIRGDTFERWGKPMFTFRTRAPIPQPKLEFPPLPADVKWYNDEEFTPEFVGVDENWRLLCTLDTSFPPDTECFIPRTGEWIPASAVLGKTFEERGVPAYSFRTKAPIPTA